MEWADEIPKSVLPPEHAAVEEDDSIISGKPKSMLEKKDSLQNEKQISIDPISVRDSAHMLPPPPNAKFMSCSLPNSASSSPRFALTLAKQKKKLKNQPPSDLSRQHSVALGNLERLREKNRMQRSKSCGEGRASQPSADFDQWSTGSGNQQRENDTEVKAAEKRGGGEEGKNRRFQKTGGGGEEFKCGACLFLPGLGKGKTIRARKEAEVEFELEHSDLVSQRASLEKFECGSWRSSAIINYEEDGDATSNLFFDLPLELMGCSSVNDAESPVTVGFVFDNNKDHHRKGVLKTTTSCNSSSRHVQFSTSSPTTPRLRKARDDFTAFLEAQIA